MVNKVEYLRIEESIRFELGLVVEISLFVKVVVQLNYEFVMIIIIIIQ